MSYVHRVRARYVDCDMQGVIYNAHYLTYVDDGFDCWLRELHPSFETEFGWEVMVKRAELTWEAPARFGDILDIELAVTRWGNTSFDATGVATVDGREIVTAVLTYVAVDHDEYRPVPIPDLLRRHLE